MAYHFTAHTAPQQPAKEQQNDPQAHTLRAQFRAQFRAWVDGSVFEGGRNVGAGWVIADEKSGRTLEANYRRIGETARGSTTLAEIYAATAALDAIREKARIVLHSDDQDLCRVMQYGQLAARIRRNENKPAMQRAYTALYNAVARHESVTVIKSTAAETPEMMEAHQLAQAGAYAPLQCAVPPPARQPRAA